MEEKLITPIRLWNVTPRTLKGWNSLGGCSPSDCGMAADPAGGTWAGVK